MRLGVSLFASAGERLADRAAVEAGLKLRSGEITPPGEWSVAGILPGHDMRHALLHTRTPPAPRHLSGLYVIVPRWQQRRAEPGKAAAGLWQTTGCNRVGSVVSGTIEARALVAVLAVEQAAFYWSNGDQAGSEASVGVTSSRSLYPSIALASCFMLNGICS
jgi:hypothetical protein